MMMKKTMKIYVEEKETISHRSVRKKKRKKEIVSCHVKIVQLEWNRSEPTVEWFHLMGEVTI